MKVYLDNSATTPIAQEVIDSMMPYLTHEMGNAQSVHSFGQRARAAVDRARCAVAELIGAQPAEIVFLSGGTEADNTAVRGIAEVQRAHGNHLITTAIEHPAVLATCEALAKDGFEVDYLPVSRNGIVKLDSLSRAIRQDTILVSVMHANNEIGTIQPIEQIGALIRQQRERHAPHLHFHSDAVQSAGKIPVDVNSMGVDLLSLSSHKIHGPKGVGALYIRKGTRIGKLLYGGHHERDRRAGTENVPGIVGFGHAAELASNGLAERVDQMRLLRDFLESQVTSRIQRVRINGDLDRRLPNISNISFDGLDGESLLIALDLKGIAVSTGAACASGSLEPSHVLQALGLSREEVRGSLRFSFSSFNTLSEVSYAVDVLEEVVLRLRSMAPQDELSAPAGI